MAFHSSLLESDETSNSLTMNERDRLDSAADGYACQTTAELSEAVSVSLGLDSVSSPVTSMNLGSRGAFADSCDSAASCSRAAPEFGAAACANSRDDSPGEDDFGEVCQGVRQVSCMDMLRSSDLDSPNTRTLMSRYVCRESNLFTSPAAELPAPSQVEKLLSLKQYSAYSAHHPSLHRDTRDAWRTNDCAYGGRPEPERDGPGGLHFWGKYCSCDQTSPGSRQDCPGAWYGKGEPCGKSGMRAAIARGYGQVERYQSVIAQGQATFPTIKTEPTVWLDCSERTFRHDDSFTGVYLSDRRVCQVCSDDASGCHYGAVTCGSCKVFFKRAAAGKQNHLCASRNDCTIDKLRRKNCASCRLKRCFMSGMSLKGRRLKGTGQTRNEEEEQPPVAWALPQRFAKNDVTGMAAACAQGASTASQDTVLNISPTPGSCLSLLSILQSIEPAMVNAGHDPAQPDTPAALLNSLNELGERQLVTVVRWAKKIPGFRDLHVDDQMSVIQLSWMGVMVFALGWRSYQLTNSSMLYFAPDLVFNDHRMRESSMYEHCVKMKLLSEKFCMLKVTQEEFLCMKALVFFSILPVEGLKSQQCFNEVRTLCIKELNRLANNSGETTGTQRLYQLTQLLDFLQSIVWNLHQFTYDLFTQAQALKTHVYFPLMMTEIVSVHVPKILSGRVKPILFHDST